jgi:hypothetical protein
MECTLPSEVPFCFWKKAGAGLGVRGAGLVHVLFPGVKQRVFQSEESRTSAG